MIRVREEAARDEAAVRRVNLEAFGAPGEADLVDALRRNGGVTLSLVAEEDGEVVGHVLFSPVSIAGAQGLGPMAVLPSFQRRGVGSALVREGLERLRAAGHRAVIVLGHPEYYPRFGFGRASEFGIRWEHPCPDAAFMALELAAGSLSGGGVARYRPEFGAVS